MDAKHKIFYFIVSFLVTISSIINIVYENKITKFILLILPTLLYVPLFLIQIKQEKFNIDNAFDAPNNLVPVNTPYNDIQLPQEMIPTKVSSIQVLNEQNNEENI